MSEIVFLVEESPEGGFTGRALGHGIFIESETFEALREDARDAVGCHFEGQDEKPRIIRLHLVKDELLAV